MKYFIKERDAFGAQGPFDIAEIKRRLAEGGIGLDWVAASDAGALFEKSGTVPGPGQHWVPLGELPGIGEQSHTPESEPPPRATEPPPKPSSSSGPSGDYASLLKSLPPPRSTEQKILEEVKEANRSLRIISFAA